MDCLDLFSGAGGFTLGMKAAGFRTAYGVEIVRERRATFVRHTPDVRWLGGDASQVDFSAVKGKAEVIYGGPPCQPFSNGGLQRGEDDRRNGIPHFVRAVQEAAPRGFIMENVVGLATGSRKSYLDRVVAELEGLGYDVSWRILDAADFGVPQHRRRLFVAGVACGRFSFPDPTHGPGRASPHIAVKDALPVDVPLGRPCPAKVTYFAKPDLRPSCFDGLLFNGSGRAIDVDRPCRTIVASAGGARTHFFDTMGVVREYHSHLLAGGEPRKGEVPGCRRLSVEESAILQGFPADLEFQGPKSSQYAQVGDAVPPPLAAALGKAMNRSLCGR